MRKYEVLRIPYFLPKNVVFTFLSYFMNIASFSKYCYGHIYFCFFRLWNRTHTKGYVDSLKDLSSLCHTIFYRTVPCLGLFGGDFSNNHNPMTAFVTVNFPVERKVSERCLQYYQLKDNETNTAMSELLGIGLCAECLSEQPKQELDSDMEYIKSEAEDCDYVPKIELEDDVYDSDSNLRRTRRPRKVRKTSNLEQDIDVKSDNGLVRSRGRKAKGDYSEFSSEQIDGKRMFKCPKCDKIFRSPRAMNSHRARHHQWGPFSCYSCANSNSPFDYISDLFMHFSNSHQGQSLNCPCCNVMSFQINCEKEFMKHYRLCYKKKCRSERSVHKKSYEQKKVFKCSLCIKSFASRSTLKGHEDWHKGLKPIKCKECNFATAFATSMYTHNKIHLREKGLEKTENDIPIVFKCEHCSKVFNTVNYLQEHTRRIHENKPDQRVCEQCGLVCTSRTNLRRHKARSHPTDSSRQCKTCGYMAADNSGLQIHLRVHEEPNFICRFCAKAVKSKQSLQAHERSHTGENPFKCDICSYVCKSSSVLRKHIVLQHEKYQQQDGNKVPSQNPATVNQF